MDLAYPFLYNFKLIRIRKKPLLFSGHCQISLDKDLTPVLAFFHDIPRPSPEEDALPIVPSPKGRLITLI